jgi:hypothetical protein
MKTTFKLTVAAALLAAVPSTAVADRRGFAFTYEYVTQPKGNLELEFYNTQSRSSFDAGGASAVQNQIEIEYGITNHTDVSLYQVFDQTGGGGSLRYSKTKVRMRHRFSERGEWPVNVLFYLELAKPFAKGEVAVEPKLILAKDFGSLSVSLNLIPEVEFENEDDELEVKFVPGWALGVGYELCPQWKLGAETWGAVEDAFKDGSTTEAWAGPALSWAPADKFWITATAGMGLTEHSDDAVVRFIAALGL